MINQGINLTFIERSRECFDNPHYKYLAVGLLWTCSVGAGSFISCSLKEDAVPPTNQCIMAEMPKFFAYGCSALGIIAGTYILAKRLYPQLSINTLRDGLESNFRQLQNAIQEIQGTISNPQTGSNQGRNSQNAGDGARASSDPSNPTASPSSVRVSQNPSSPRVVNV